MNVLQVDKTENIKLMSEGLVYDKLSFGDCHITYKNIEHPYIQKFFMNNGVHINIYNKNQIEITGFLSLRGSDLHNFLVRSHGVNLEENPTALDTIVEEAKPLPPRCRIN